MSLKHTHARTEREREREEEEENELIPTQFIYQNPERKEGHLKLQRGPQSETPLLMQEGVCMRQVNTDVCPPGVVQIYTSGKLTQVCVRQV